MSLEILLAGNVKLNLNNPFIPIWVQYPDACIDQMGIREIPLRNSRNTPQLAAIGIANFRNLLFIITKIGIENRRYKDFIPILQQDLEAQS